MKSSMIEHPPAPVSDNERHILDLVRRDAGITRAALTRATGLTSQSISRLVEALTERGLVAPGERVANGRGQPSYAVRLRHDSRYSLGISLMTDAMSLVVMDLSGRVIAEATEELETPVTRKRVLDQARRQFDRLIGEHDIDADRIVGVGVGITGYFVEASKQLNPPEPLSEFALEDLEAVFSDFFGWPAWIDNDGNVAAMGECQTGAGLEYSTFAYVFLSKGIGGSVVIDNQVFRGAFGNAGEYAGILPAELHEERPSLELLRQMICERGVELGDLNELTAGFDPYWPGIDEWMAVARPHLQSIISSISAVLDPQAIVLGGRIPQPLAERLCAELQYFNVPRRGVPRPTPKLLTSRVRGDAAAIGAAATPLKALFFR
ncbi:MAG: ROK family transcriptional regulator [Pseudomonadota bacterium]